jgi:hypothetical protein
MPSTFEASGFLNQRSKLLPGAFSICEFCGQQPESIAFDPDECRDPCPTRRAAHAAVNPADDIVAPAVWPRSRIEQDKHLL